MRATASIGRGLAVALGVGAAVATGAAGHASAETARDSSSAADSAARSPSAGPARTSSRPRASTPQRTAQARPRNAAPAAASASRAVRAAASSLDRTTSPGPATAVPATTVPTGQPTAAATGSDPISTLLLNRTPTAAGAQTGQGPGGVISGQITVDDPDSGTFGYTVTTKPANGTASVDSAGRFTYSPAPAFAHIGGTDTFTVTVSDAPSGFHLHGLGGLLNLLTFGLFGSSGHTSTRTISVTVAPVNNAPSASPAVGPPRPAHRDRHRPGQRHRPRRGSVELQRIRNHRPG